MKHLAPTLMLLILLGALLVPAVAQPPRAAFLVNSTADSVDATPSFVLNGEKLSNMPYSEFEARLNAAVGG